MNSLWFLIGIISILLTIHYARKKQHVKRELQFWRKSNIDGELSNLIELHFPSMLLRQKYDVSESGGSNTVRFYEVRRNSDGSWDIRFANNSWKMERMELEVQLNKNKFFKKHDNDEVKAKLAGNNAWIRMGDWLYDASLDVAYQKYMNASNVPAAELNWADEERRELAKFEKELKGERNDHDTIQSSVKTKLSKMRHAGSVTALTIGILSFLGSFILNSSETRPEMLESGLVMIFGALAFQSAKKRLTGEETNSPWQRNLELVAICYIAATSFFRSNLSVLIIAHPLPYFIIPLWAILAYTTIAFKLRKIPLEKSNPYLVKPHMPNRGWVALVFICVGIMAYGYLYSKNTSINWAVLAGSNTATGLLWWAIYYLSFGRKYSRKSAVIVFLMIFISLMASDLIAYSQNKRAATILKTEIAKSFDTLYDSATDFQNIPKDP